MAATSLPSHSKEKKNKNQFFLFTSPVEMFSFRKQIEIRILMKSSMAE